MQNADTGYKQQGAFVQATMSIPSLSGTYAPAAPAKAKGI